MSAIFLAEKLDLLATAAASPDVRESGVVLRVRPRCSSTGHGPGTTSAEVVQMHFFAGIGPAGDDIQLSCRSNVGWGADRAVVSAVRLGEFSVRKCQG
jgi:hypothetical protein